MEISQIVEQASWTASLIFVASLFVFMWIGYLLGSARPTIIPPPLKVYNRMTNRAKQRTSIENVTDVLDTLEELI